MSDTNAEAGEAETAELIVLDDGEPLSYGDAAAELDSILTELEGATVDVDALGAQVQRASDLIRHCRTRLESIRSDVDRVVDDLRPNGATDT